MARLIALTILIFAAGCSDSGPDKDVTDAQRLTAIVAHAQQSAADSRHRELLARSKVFVNLDGLDVPCVGVTVPNEGNSNRIHLSFTQDWFHSHSDDEVAEAMLQDLQKALADPARDD